LLMQDADDEAPEEEPVRMLISAFAFKGHYYELKVANSMVEEDDLLKELLTDILWLYLLLVGTILITNSLVLKKLWKPFYAFLNQLKQYRLGSSAAAPSVSTRIREFNDLQLAVTSLIKHSNEVFEQQKQFIGNASHELQTPLTITTHKLELLIEQGRLEDQQAHAVSEIYEIIQRMIRLNKSLLLLSKIDNKQLFNNEALSLI